MPSRLITGNINSEYQKATSKAVSLEGLPPEIQKRMHRRSVSGLTVDRVADFSEQEKVAFSSNTDCKIGYIGESPKKDNAEGSCVSNPVETIRRVPEMEYDIVRAYTAMCRV